MTALTRSYEESSSQSTHQYPEQPMETLSPNMPWLLVSYGLLGLLLQAVYRFIRDDYRRRQHKCAPIPTVRQWDPIWGLDLAWTQYKALKSHNFIPWLAAMHHNRPKTFKVKFLGKRQIFTIEPENLKAMTALTWKDYGIAPIRRYKSAGMPFADKGVNTVDGDDWVFSRFLIKPFFMREVYADIDRITPYTDQLLTLLPPDGETFNIQPLIQRWFLDVTSRFIFGEAMGSLTYPERAKITWAMLDVLRGGRLRVQLWNIRSLLQWAWWYDAIKVVHGFVNVHIDRTYAEIEQRRKRQAAGEEVGPEPLHLLWYMASNCPDKEELRSQLCLLFVPNNDTTSVFTSNVIWHLARNPESWAKLRDEVRAHGDAPLTFEALRQMKYVQAVLNETHRLNPNNVTQVRTCLKDTTLPRGGGPDGGSPIFVRKGDMVQVTKTVLQRDPEYWGDDPHAFRPERWAERTHFWEFVPFSGGPRRCPAQMMVQTESAYLVARLAQVYARIEAHDANPYQAVMRVGPSNKTGVLISLYK